MAKKNFKENNPALLFISGAEKKSEKKSEKKAGKKSEKKKKKAEKSAVLPAGNENETKSRRVQLLVRPSLVQKAKKAARKKDISLNELVNRAIAEYIK